MAWHERDSVRFLGRALEDEFNDIARSLGGDVSSREAGDDYLLTTNALYHGGPVSWALTPKIFDEDQLDILKDAAETMGRIMDKVTRHFMRDESFRKLFRLPPALEELCRTPTGYKTPIPIARVDLFFDEETGDYTFCEMNTDGSAGMTTTVEVTRTVQRTEAYRQLLRKHPELTARTLDPTGAVIDAILATYDEWVRERTADAGSTGFGRPVVAIVDYSESASFDELKDITKQLADRDVHARYCDIRDLRLGRLAGRDALLTPDGPVNCVYRRAVTSEIADKPCVGTRALARAGRLNLACVVGGLSTWPCATKTVFAVLRSQATRSILGDDERAFIERHVPQTELLDTTSDLRPYQDKDGWIVKPARGVQRRGRHSGHRLHEGRVGRGPRTLRSGRRRRAGIRLPVSHAHAARGQARSRRGSAPCRAHEQHGGSLPLSRELLGRLHALWEAGRYRRTYTSAQRKLSCHGKAMTYAHTALTCRTGPGRPD